MGPGEAGLGVRILYGGSVKPSNAAASRSSWSFNTYTPDAHKLKAAKAQSAFTSSGRSPIRCDVSSGTKIIRFLTH